VLLGGPVSEGYVSRRAQHLNRVPVIPQVVGEEELTALCLANAGPVIRLI
jgi:hypothetical protein